jgi:hypothetical protein
VNAKLHNAPLAAVLIAAVLSLGALAYSAVPTRSLVPAAQLQNGPTLTEIANILDCVDDLQKKRKRPITAFDLLCSRPGDLSLAQVARPAEFIDAVWQPGRKSHLSD